MFVVAFVGWGRLCGELRGLHYSSERSPGQVGFGLPTCPRDQPGSGDVLPLLRRAYSVSPETLQKQVLSRRTVVVIAV